jgi:hypothetical protein
MLFVLLLHIIIIAGCLWTGFLFYTCILNTKEKKPFIFYAVTGLIVHSAIVQVAVLFLPINLFFSAVLFFLLTIIAALKIKIFKEFCKMFVAEISSFPISVKAFIIFFWLMVLMITSGPTMMDDTESYHIQTIKWIQEHGTVPGLVNLHERFGFNSSWFSSVALLNFSSKTTGGFTLLNSILSVLLGYWLISKYDQLRKENNLQAAFAILIILVTCLIVWPLLRGNASTTNYDFIATCIVLVLFTEIFLSSNNEISPSIEWIVWPTYLFTVRIINFPLLVLSVLAAIILIKQKKTKALLFSMAYCLLLIIPFLIRNTIIAGYPFYPATSFDLFNVDWKPDPQLTEKLIEYIKYYNRVSTTYLEIEQTKALGTNWVPSWFKYLFSFDKVLVISGLIGIVLSIIKIFINRNKSAALLLLISILWLILWFFISPDPRFVYGILLSGVLLLAYYLISLVKNIQLLKNVADILVILIIAGTTFYSISKLWKQKEYRNWIKPAQLPQPPVKEFVIDGINFRIPDPINNNWNARCYGTELPCLYKIDPRLKPRGKDIRNGFRLEK